MKKIERKFTGSCFTLIEMVIVIAVILILTGIAIPAYQGIQSRARRSRAVLEIEAFNTAIATFQMDMGRLPKSLDELVRNPGAGKKWKGPYLNNRTTVPKDPWGNSYVYQHPSVKGGQDAYDIISYGSDGAPGGSGSAEDIDNWPDENE